MFTHIKYIQRLAYGVLCSVFWLGVAQAAPEHSVSGHVAFQQNPLEQTALAVPNQGDSVSNTPTRVYRLAVIMDGDVPINRRGTQFFLNAMNDPILQRNAGLIGHVVQVEDAVNTEEGDTPASLARIDAFAAQLMQRNDIDAICSSSIEGAKALLRHNNGTTPIWLLANDDPVQSGIIPSYDDSGVDNLLVFVQSTYPGQSIQYFKELLNIKTLGILLGPSRNTSKINQNENIKAMAAKDGLQSYIYQITDETPEQCAKAVHELIAQNPDAVFVYGKTCLNTKTSPNETFFSKLTNEGIAVVAENSQELDDSGVLLSMGVELEQRMHAKAKEAARMLADSAPRRQTIQLQYRPRLAINLATATFLGFMPSYDLLASCDVFFHYMSESLSKQARAEQTPPKTLHRIFFE